MECIRLFTSNYARKVHSMYTRSQIHRTRSCFLTSGHRCFDGTAGHGTNLFVYFFIFFVYDWILQCQYIKSYMMWHRLKKIPVDNRHTFWALISITHAASHRDLLGSNESGEQWCRCELPGRIGHMYILCTYPQSTSVRPKQRKIIRSRCEHWAWRHFGLPWLVSPSYI